MKKEVDSVIEQVQYKQDYLESDEYLTFLEALIEALNEEYDVALGLAR